MEGAMREPPYKRYVGMGLTMEARVRLQDDVDELANG